MDQHTYDKGKHIAVLINKARFNTISDKEKMELNKWIDASETNAQLFKKLNDPGTITPTLQWLEQIKYTAPKQNKKIISIRTSSWIAAAALIVIIAGAGILTRINKTTTPPQTAKTNTIQPGSPGATLTTATGTRITLNKVTNGSIKIDDKSQAFAQNSTLIYKRDAELTSMHTLSTAAGGEYRLILPDGSKVWLNAESSISYPTAFTGEEREVMIKGEGYFEVTHDPSKPFVVRVGENRIKVLGTKFNVHAYAPGTNQSVSLVGGKIRLQTPKQQTILMADEKAIISNETIRVEKDNGIMEDIAWTKGMFSFRKTSMQEVMQQVSRWYDVKVVFKDDIQRTFTGKILRSSSLEEVMKMLQLSAGIQFEIEGREITVRGR